MLTSLTLNNVRSWKSATIPLSPLTVIVGPNASGKTTILEALSFMAHTAGVAHNSWAPRPGAAATFLRSGTQRLDMSSKGDVSLSLFSNGSETTINGSDPVQFSWSTTGKLISAGGDSTLLGQFARLRLLRLESRRLAASSYSEEESPRVQEDGSHLPTVLASLKQESPGIFAQIEKYLQRVVPGLEAIRAPRAKVMMDESRTVVIDGTATTLRETRSYIGNELLFDMEGASGIPANQAGEGTILTLGLLTALAGTDGLAIALLDDIDMRLHPKAQGELVAIIRALMAAGLTRQFIGTTHSPFFLQHLRPEEVVVVDNTPDGSVARRLDSHPDFEKWKDTMGLGEFWSWAGESWVRPK